MADHEAEARERLAQCARIFGRLNLLGVGGHVSLRIPESDLILITPGGALDKTRLTANDMVTMDAEGARVRGKYPTPRETAIHVAIHARRPELGSIAHLHAHWSTVFSVSERPLRVVLNYASGLGATIPRYEDPHLVETPEQGEALADVLGDGAAVLMQGHGITTVGLTLDEMFDVSVNMEDNARVLWEALAIGDVRYVAPEVIAEHMATRRKEGTTARALRYYANLEAPTDAQRHFELDR